MTAAKSPVSLSPDVLVEAHSSFYVLQPMSGEARSWIDANVSDEQTWWGSGLVVEHRYVEELIAGMRGDGLQVTA